MTWTKGRKFRKGKLLLQYWYKDGKSSTKKLMVIGVAGALVQAFLYRGQYGAR